MPPSEVWRGGWDWSGVHEQGHLGGLVNVTAVRHSGTYQSVMITSSLQNRTVLFYGVRLAFYERSSGIGRPLVIMVTLCRWRLRSVVVVLAGICVPLIGRTQAQVRFWDSMK